MSVRAQHSYCLPPTQQPAAARQGTAKRCAQKPFLDHRRESECRWSRGMIGPRPRRAFTGADPERQSAAPAPQSGCPNRCQMPESRCCRSDCLPVVLLVCSSRIAQDILLPNWAFHMLHVSIRCRLFREDFCDYCQWWPLPTM